MYLFLLLVEDCPSSYIRCPYICIRTHFDTLLDLRDPDITSLNFTKTINLALSERGINSIRNARCHGLLDEILKETIPMRGRMIHGQEKDGKLIHESQEYDPHGRVRRPIINIYGPSADGY